MFVLPGRAATSVTISSLPSEGVTLYARLFFKMNGMWKWSDYTYTEAGTAEKPEPAELTTPSRGSTLPGASATFRWTAGKRVWAYELWLGTTGPGSKDVFNSGGILSTSVSVSNLPTQGKTMYARLYSKVNGTWQFIDYVYVEAQM